MSSALDEREQSPYTKHTGYIHFATSILTKTGHLTAGIINLFTVEKGSNSSFAGFASWNNSLLLLQIVTNNIVHFVNNFIASDAIVKKLFVVIFLQQPVNSSIILMTTNLLSDIDDGRDSSFLKYGKHFMMYLLLTSDANQNLMPKIRILAHQQSNSYW
ncbi:hypothetical protein V1477_004477 [Vespula maculifrons]|uniref:Uncharacterized protein n=1 Tax=Vespula maculifrons TaxID=7453 RepID=A0ABD2CRR0_VESMC